MSVTDEKYRHEYKYLISSAQLPLLINRISCIMKPDKHVGADGIYNIRSLYFDDYYNSCYYENENGVDPREKFRIRIYNHSSERISLECKQKSNDKTLKRSELITYNQAIALINNRYTEINDSLTPLTKKLAHKMDTRFMHPVVIVEYERIPYVFGPGNVRVTFDTNISSSVETEDFFNPDIPKQPIMPAGQHLMEVKFDEFLPDFIYTSLNLGQLQRATYSKFYLSRKLSMK